MYMAASRTVRVIGPTTLASTQPSIWNGPIGMRPKDGLCPKQPVQQAGMRMEPPPSEPVASGTIPEAMAAEAPPLEPPGVRSGFQGLRLTPNSRFFVNAV